MTKIKIESAAAMLGRRGAKAVKEKYGPAHYEKFSRAGVEARKQRALERGLTEVRVVDNSKNGS